MSNVAGRWGRVVAAGVVLVVAGGDVAAADVTPGTAVQMLGQSAPDLLTPTQPSAIDGLQVAPRLASTGAEIAVAGTLSGVEVGADPLDGFAIETADGPINVNLQGVSSVTDATVVNQATAVFSSVLPSTDLAIRPRAQGADAVLSLRDGAGPRSFSFQLSMGPDQQLVPLADGTVAVTDAAIAPPDHAQSLDPNIAPAEEAADAFTDPSLVNDPDLTAPSPETAAADIATEGGSDDAVAPPVNDLAPTEAEPVDADPDPDPDPSGATASVTSVTLPISTPAHTAADEANSARAALDQADSQNGDATLMVIAAQPAADAAGHTVTASLTVTGGDTLTLTVPDDPGLAFPASALLRLSTPSAAVASTKAAARSVRYGLSDGRDAYYAPVDPRLKNGPLNIGFARNVVPYNSVSSPATITKVVDWVTAVRAAHLKPFLTLKLPDQKVGSSVDPLPTPTAYRSAVKALMTYPGVKGKVTLWGAVNEPDLHSRHHDPSHISVLARKPTLAARYWREAQALVETNVCAGCTIVAGEFDGESWDLQKDYIAKYGGALKKLRHDGKIKALPRVWSLHAYNDLVNSTSAYDNPTTAAFTAFVKDYNHPRVWLSEQGVLLQTSGTAPAADPDAPHERRTRLYGHPARQRIAALDFLRLSDTDPSIDRVYYYSYQGDDPNDGNHPFDSALVDFYGKARPAYCVLALARHPKTCTPRKPPTITRPEPTGDPSFTGPMTPGGPLTADPGTWTGDVTQFDYRWQRIDLTQDGTTWADIPGATDVTFAPGSDMVGWGVRVLVRPSGSDQAWVRSAAGVIQPQGSKPSIVLTADGAFGPKVTIFPGGLDTKVRWCQAPYGLDPTTCPPFSEVTVSGALESSDLGNFGPTFNCGPYSYWVEATNSAGTVHSERFDVNAYCT